MTGAWTARDGALAEQPGRMGPEELRSEFPILGPLVPRKARMAHAYVGRPAPGGIVPKTLPIEIGGLAEAGTETLFQAREVETADPGTSAGIVTSGRQGLRLRPSDTLGGWCGGWKVRLASNEPGAPAPFHPNSNPAKGDLPHRLLAQDQPKAFTMDEEARSSRRTLRKDIHPEVLSSCLALVGITDPAPGSIWSTMLLPTDVRQMEAHFDFGMSEDRVLDFLGAHSEARHIPVAGVDAVLSPAGSIHMGAGTGPSAFVRRRTRENRAVRDVAPVPVGDLR